MVFFELLPRNQTINSDVYCRQLNKFNAAAKKKRPEFVNCEGVIFHHDNATPHTYLATRQKLCHTLGFAVLILLGMKSPKIHSVQTTFQLFFRMFTRNLLSMLKVI